MSMLSKLLQIPAILLVAMLFAVPLVETTNADDHEKPEAKEDEAKSEEGEKEQENSESKDKDLEEIEFDLPKPIFVGTPPAEEAPDYVEIIPEDRPVFKAPKGVKNVALEKEVTASDEPFIGDLEQITDGDKEATDGSYVILGFDVQWVQIDLEEEHEIYGLLYWFFHADPRHFRDVVVQASNDADFVEGVTTIFNNDRDNSAGQGVGKQKEYYEEARGRLLDLNKKPVKARYIRIYSNGSSADDQNYHTEIEIYGKPVK